MKERKLKMAEMAEMNKAFDNFDKACAKVISDCQAFIDMDINKTTEPTLEPSGKPAKMATQRDEVANFNPTFYYW